MIISIMLHLLHYLHYAPSLTHGLIILSIALHGHLGVDASSIHVVILLSILHHHEGPGCHVSRHVIISRVISRSRGGILSGGDGAEVTRASTEEASHGTGGSAEAGYEHAAEVTADSQPRTHLSQITPVHLCPAERGPGRGER